MMDKKNTLLFVISSVFIIGLFFILGFLFNKSTGSSPKMVASNTNEPVKITNPNSALLEQYKSTMTGFDQVMNSAIESDNPDINKKLVEYYKLRKEIGSLLTDDANMEDLNSAKQKIELLQEKVNDLSNRNIVVEADNIRLNALLKRLSQQQNSTGNNPVQDNIVNRPVSQEKQTEPSLFIASDLKINRIKTGADENSEEKESNEKISGSFFVKNSRTYNNAELVIILQQPNGQVLRNSAWESGVFITKEGQRKIYSLLLKFDYNKDEVQKCNFSINTEEYQKGRYLLMVYHKGILIANVSKILS